MRFFLFFIFVFVFYGSTLRNEFVSDDADMVVYNPYVQSLKYLPRILNTCPWEYYFGGCKEYTIYYRPIQNLSYILTWQISSKAWFFHLVNLLYFFVAVSLVFVLVKLLTNNSIISFLTTIFFLIHPINTEVVDWISAVPELTYTIFILLATIFFIRYRQKPSTKKLILVSVFYFLSTLSKEPAVLLPVIFIFLDLFFFRISFKKLLNKDLLKIYFISIAIFLIYLRLRYNTLGILVDMESHSYGNFSFPEQIYAFFTLFSGYLLKLIKPWPLLYFYSFEKRSIFLSFPFIGSFVVVLVFFAVFLVSLIKRKDVLALSLFWIFIFIAPALVFLSSAGENVFSERYNFTPSIGFSLILAIVFFWFWENKYKLRFIFITALVFIFICSFCIIRARNLDWKNNYTLYNITLKDNPRAYAVRYSLATNFGVEKDWNSAERELKIILEQNSKWVDIHLVYAYLGDIYQIRRDLNKALEYYKKSIESSPAWTPDIYNAVGIIYVQKKEYLNALVYFCKASEIDSKSGKTKETFNRLSSIFSSFDESKLSDLWTDIINGNSFKKSEIEKIKYVKKVCEEDKCSFIFLAQDRSGETILPFLILGSSKNKFFKTEPSFDNQTGRIVLGISSDYEKAAVDFIFPTCDGIYYEVIVAK